MRAFAFTTLAALGLVTGFQATPAMAQDRDVLGYGRLFTNDYFGDNKDRWRTGSYVLSQVRGYEWNGARPDTFGAIIEYRFRSEIIAPSRLSQRAPDDRQYAGMFSFGIHTHFEEFGAEFSTGVDLVAVGPQTGLGGFQESVHRLIGAKIPEVLDDQIEDGFHLSGTIEVAKSYTFGPAMVRPFVEVSAGVEDIARIGFDAFFGPVGRDDLLLRDVTTGQLYRGTDNSVTGFSFVVGADYVAVGDSVFLPNDTGPAAKEQRSRGRAGLHWQMAEDTSFFYGVTYLSEEFEGQSEGQFLGSLKLNFNF